MPPILQRPRCRPREGQARHAVYARARRISKQFSSVQETGEEGGNEARSHGMAEGRVAEVCCSIVVGARSRKRFRGVGGLLEVGAGGDLRRTGGGWGVLSVWKSLEETSYAISCDPIWEIVQLAES
jgi:hypothetical protein